MRRAIAIFALQFCSCLASSCLAADLDQRLAALLDSKPAAFGTAGIHVADAATGASVYAFNEDRLFLPASNLKLFTSALALERLGAGYRFTTRVLLAPSGDLVLSGSGDPSLSGRVYPYKKDTPPGPPLDPIEDMAAQIVKRGIRRIDGDVIGDDRLFPWVPYPSNWSIDDTEREYGAPVSALSLDDNTVAIMIQPGQRSGDHASMSMSPPVEFLTIDHRVVTGPRATSAATGPAIRLRQVPGSRQWIVTGSIPAGHAAVTEFLPVDDPAAFAAAALYDALVRRGVAIRGRPVARHRAPGVEYAAPVGDEVASRQSPPLAELLRVVEKVSQNLHAELMLREVGRVGRREGAQDGARDGTQDGTRDGTRDGTHDGTHDGTTASGLVEMSGFVKSLETPSDRSPGETRAAGARMEVRIDDGSGLGRNTLVTPKLITRLLAHEYASKNRDLWVAFLPAGGEDGTLEHRLCCVSDGAGIRAKTGTLSRAIALSGYALSKTSGMYAFSILVNDFAAPTAEVRAWVDKIALALLE
jgi:D-alanyl-D-alanine carboxypeptidase/D-alanyl-D-alanine-endopeptidase (penicillin-binding protein 4)